MKQNTRQNMRGNTQYNTRGNTQRNTRGNTRRITVNFKGDGKRYRGDAFINKKNGNVFVKINEQQYERYEGHRPNDVLGDYGRDVKTINNLFRTIVGRY